MDSGPSGHTKLNRGFRSCSTHIRICTQVCKFVEIISDGMCCLLRPDLPLRGQHLSLCNPHVPLCTLASPTPSSQHPICAPLFPLFPRPTSIVLPSQSPVAFCPFRTGVSILFFYFFKQQIVNILDFVCHSISVVTQLCCCSTKPAKLIHQQKHMTVFQ